MTDSADDNTATIELPDKTYFKIGEVAKLLEVEPYVLRYWETEFEVLAPEKTDSGQRVYQRDDIELLLQIKTLLYEEMFTIAGARRQIERKRAGKTSYFDLDEAQQGRAGGTAVAGQEQLRTELEEARQQLAATQNELRETESQLEKLQDENSEREGTVDELRRRLKETSSELEATRREVDELEDDRRVLRAELQEAHDWLEAQSTNEESPAVDELRNEVARLERELETSRQKHRDLEERAQRRQRERNHLLGSLRQEVETLATRSQSGTRVGR